MHQSARLRLRQTQQPEAKDSFESLRLQNKSIADDLKLFLQEIKELLIAPLPSGHQQVVDTTQGRREKEKEVHNSVILAILPS